MFVSQQNRRYFFLRFAGERGERVTRDGISAQPVARDSRSALASCFVFAFALVCSAGYMFVCGTKRQAIDSIVDTTLTKLNS